MSGFKARRLTVRREILNGGFCIGDALNYWRLIGLTSNPATGALLWSPVVMSGDVDDQAFG